MSTDISFNEPAATPAAVEFTAVQQRIVDVTIQLLAESKDHDVAIRDVAAGADVQSPVIYRHFGGKDELLAVSIEYVYDQYLDHKDARRQSADPLDDLRYGWDTHVEFAIEHPGAYQLLMSPRTQPSPPAAEKSLDIIAGRLNELGRQGRLLTTTEEAARIVLSTNIGVALSLVALPKAFPDRAMSTRVRDVVHRSVIDFGSDDPSGVAPEQQAAITLLAAPSDRLSAGEAHLFQELLTRIAAPV